MSEWLWVAGKFTFLAPSDIKEVRCGFCETTFPTNKSKADHLTTEHKARVTLLDRIYEYRVLARPAASRKRAWTTYAR